MRLFFTLLLCVACVPNICSIFDGTCPRKEPPPGVLVVRPGSTLYLTCRGHVKVDGVKVSLSKINQSNGNKRDHPAQVSTTTEKISSAASAKSDSVKINESDGSPSPHTEAGVSSAPGEHTESPHILQPTSTSTPPKSNNNWEDDYDEEEEEEEEEEGSRVTRGIKSERVWKWNKRTVEKGDKDWERITFRRSGSILTLDSVRLSDSGRFTCHDGEIEKFAVKVIVADPPESPSLFCYKKSPRGKTRCEWSPQKPVIKQPHCYLLLSKSSTDKFHHLPCSFSSAQSRCWCTLDYDEDEQRVLHVAYLCVTSIIGNATSPLLYFTPLSILKPDPPSNVSIRKEEGHDMRIKVTWNLPATWKQHDRDFELIYELKFRPSKSSFHNDQFIKIEYWRSHTITDAIPGVEYLIQLRAKEQYDGVWSDWSAPVYGRSWTAPVIFFDDITTSMYGSRDPEGSGSGEDSGSGGDPEGELPYHIVWIAALCVFILTVILAAYIFRYKDRLMAKLHSHGVVSLRHDLSQPPPSAPAAKELEALVTFDPVCYKEHTPTDTEEGEENEEELKDRMETTHFNNTSYFLLQRE